MKKLNITFCSFPDFSNNAKALYEYMSNRYGNKLNYTWIVYNKDSVDKLNKQGIKAILIGTDEFKNYVKKTDVFFTTQGNLDGDKTNKSIYVELWHGMGPKMNGYFSKKPSKEDIVGFDHMRKIFDYVIAPNDFWRVVYSSKLYVEYSRVLPLGMPKLNYFKYSNGIEGLNKVLKMDTTKFKKRIIYMPTFKKGFHHKDALSVNTSNIFDFEKYNEQDLIDYLEKNNYLLCIKRHPGDKTKYTKVESNNIKNIDDKELLKEDLSINEILNAFDMLITDYSSVGVEFLFLDRPVLYAVNDMDEYLDNRGILFSNKSFWLNGPQVKKIDKFFKETDKLLNDNKYYRTERSMARKLFFGDIKDGGCDKICDYFFNENGELNPNIKQYVCTETVLKEQVIKDKAAIKDLRSQLKEIVESKGWKFLEKLRSIKRKL